MWPLAGSGLSSDIPMRTFLFDHYYPQGAISDLRHLRDTLLYIIFLYRTRAVGSVVARSGLSRLRVPPAGAGLRARCPLLRSRRGTRLSRVSGADARSRARRPRAAPRRRASTRAPRDSLVRSYQNINSSIRSSLIPVLYRDQSVYSRVCTKGVAQLKAAALSAAHTPDTGHRTHGPLCASVVRVYCTHPPSRGACHAGACVPRLLFLRRVYPDCHAIRRHDAVIRST